MARNDHVKFTNFENLFSPEQFNQKLDKSFMGKEVALTQMKDYNLFQEEIIAKFCEYIDSLTLNHWTNFNMAQIMCGRSRIFF